MLNEDPSLPLRELHLLRFDICFDSWDFLFTPFCFLFGPCTAKKNFRCEVLVSLEDSSVILNLSISLYVELPLKKK